MRFVWAEINLAAIAHNIREIKKVLQPTTKMLGIVKADAYGHGALLNNPNQLLAEIKNANRGE